MQNLSKLSLVLSLFLVFATGCASDILEETEENKFTNNIYNAVESTNELEADIYYNATKLVEDVLQYPYVSSTAMFERYNSKYSIVSELSMEEGEVEGYTNKYLVQSRLTVQDVTVGGDTILLYGCIMYTNDTQITGYVAEIAPLSETY